MGFEVDTPEKGQQQTYCMRLPDKYLVKKLLTSNRKDLVEKLLTSNRKFGCSSITFLPDLCPKVAKDTHVDVIFRGICFKSHVNLMSINGNVKESLT